MTESNSLRSAIQYWYLPLIGGIILISIGIYTGMTPMASFAALSMLFALGFLFTGLVEILFSISNRNTMPNWGWALGFGIVTFLLGLVLVTKPETSMEVLSFFVGFTLLFRSMNSISFSLDLKRWGLPSWTALLILGLLGIAASLLMIGKPSIAGLSIVYVVAFALITGGIHSILLSFRLKSLAKWMKNDS